MNIGKAIHELGGRLGFGSATQTEHNVVSDETPDWVGQAVVDFRQRIAEDPEYTRSFVSDVLSEVKRQEALDAAESREQLDGGEWLTLPNEVHALIAKGAHSILDALMYPPERIIDGVALSRRENVVRQYYEAIGGLVSHAYLIGLDECPPALRAPGVYGHYMPGIGTLVIWERIRDVEGTLDEFVDQQNTDKDTGTVDG